MNLSGRTQPSAPGTGEDVSKYLPPPEVEYGYYAWVFYSIMGSALGISIDLLGIGMLLLLAGFCVLRMGVRTPTVLRPAALPLACGLSFVAIQTLILGQSLMGNSYVRAFVPWILGLVILQCLALRRGFLHRFAIAMLLVGASTLPYLRTYINDQTRSGLDQTIGIANPNDLGAWFGFCGVYCAILGLETRRNWLRVASWGAALGCLFVVGLTVSRAPLLAAVISIVLALRNVGKRGLVPLLALAVLAAVVYGLGLFAGTASMYAERGLEETGRFVVWPLAIERFLEVPFTGVGASHVLVFLPGTGHSITPHNSFIFIALASGAIPLAFYLAYWVRLFIDAFRINADGHEDATFLPSLLLYSFLIAMELNQSFMVPWMMATLCAVAGTGRFVELSHAAGRLRDARAARRSNLVVRASRARA
jgi:hypothetical protein